MSRARAKPTLLWLRRDLRLADHPGWDAARRGGGPVVPVFVLDPLIEKSYGAAPLWRLGESIADLSRTLAERGSRLILRRGDALETLQTLIAETGAHRVVWSRLYDRRAIDRDAAIKAVLAQDGIEALSVNGSLLHEPWTVETGQGGFYKVYTPFWRAVRDRPIAEVKAPLNDLAPPTNWPATDDLKDWDLGKSMNRGAAIVAPHARIGEAAALARLEEFVAERIGEYSDRRNFLAEPGTSGLSENLAYGEIAAQRIWHAGRRALEAGAGKSAETFLKELVWREFAYHLIYHSPHIETRNWRPEWESFPWRGDNDDAERWCRGMTGIPLVDAAMRQLYVTGTMHNRARMVVASFLTKHLLTHWRVGADWFRDCLIDWDPAANVLGWQWTAGSGPDAAPYFRIFNPESQAEKFDPDGRYRDHFLAEGRDRPYDDALAFFDAVPRSWNLSPDQPYPDPIISLAEGRSRALAAYEAHRKD